MLFREWEPFYRAILTEFGYDPEADERAAASLASRLRPRGPAVELAWKGLERRFRAKEVLVLGAADSARDELVRQPAGLPLVAADGATTAALEAGRVPDLIVSDLDGRVEDQVAAVARGAVIAIHAHGDNVPAVERWFGAFEPDRVVGTSQCRATGPLRNYGGFTDGDRACFVAHGLGATRLRLVGFATNARPGRYTGTFDPTTKPRKLAWAERLIGWLRERGALVGEPSRPQATVGRPAAPPRGAPREGTAPRTDAGRAPDAPASGRRRPSS